jgi:DNA polymerase III gamma/tau subunit
VGSKPTVADVARLSEGGSSREIEQLIERIEARDRAGMLRALPRTAGSEAELVAALLDHLRAALVAHVAGSESGIVEGDPERRERLEKLGARLGLERMQIWLEELIQCRERIRTMPAHARVVLEVTLLDLCREETSWSVGEVLQRLKALEHSIATAHPTSESRARADNDVVVPQPRQTEEKPASASSAREPQAEPITSAPPSAVRTSPRGTADSWTRFLETLASSSSSLAETLRLRGKLADVAPGRAVIQLANLREHERVQTQDPRNQKLCQSAFSKLQDAPVQVVFEDQTAVRQTRDPYTAKVAELFDGRIEDEG